MAKQPTISDVRDAVRAAGPYPLEAVNFVREGLTHTVEHVHAQPDPTSDFDRHISGQQLCLGLRDYAVSQYGMMAQSVLHHWNIHRTEDFGRIVFALVDAGVLSKTANDSLDDFRAVFDFEEAFNPSDLASQIGR